MKFLSGILFFIFWLTPNCFSQDSAVAFHLGKLSSDGILLDKGWKFHTGDNPEWSKPDYDDQSWESFDPALEIQDLPQIPRSGIVWFRLILSLDSSLLKKHLAYAFQQAGASEIYLNGTLINQFGRLSAKKDEIRAYDPLRIPFLFPVNKGTRQVLAVRYALQPGAIYTKIFQTENPAFLVKINSLNNAILNYKKYNSVVMAFQFFIMGACVILAVLHLAFYIFYPRQKANLYFGLFAFLFLAANILQNIFLLMAHELSFKFIISNICLDLMLISNMLLLNAIYWLFEQKRDKMYWSLIALVILSFFLNVWLNEGWIFGAWIVRSLIALNVAWVAFQSRRKNKRGSSIILGGAISYFVFFGIFFIISRIYIQGQFALSPFWMATYILSVLSIPVATSIYLGLDFAFINMSLNQKLIDINELSRKNILQEKEKQQLLASQNETLENRVAERTSQLNESLKNLQVRQSQLIQSEKMASLGELTAGIAHEIQNPLNFVNNFSEVNKELTAELEEEIDKGNFQLVKAIAKDIKGNEEKISHHGQRADAIVKGMLQHSRISSGVKEPTDINVMADEYLRLSFQGLRAKDKSFDAVIQTDFDEHIRNVNIVPQDIGRVLLNLYNNAFYTVTEKKKGQLEGYEPTVSVSSKKIDSKIEIKVKDNGNGIPEKVIDKIFQPFFTTKPTGQGTGLGLSMSYDIIKAHGGEIKVVTKEGEFTEFIIQLPI